VILVRRQDAEHEEVGRRFMQARRTVSGTSPVPRAETTSDG
jgi:hypothetical protein